MLLGEVQLTDFIRDHSQLFWRASTALATSYTLNGGIISKFIRENLADRKEKTNAVVENKLKRLLLADIAHFPLDGEWPQILYKHPATLHFY